MLTLSCSSTHAHLPSQDIIHNIFHPFRGRRKKSLKTNVVFFVILTIHKAYLSLRLAHFTYLPAAINPSCTLVFALRRLEVSKDHHYHHSTCPTLFGLPLWIMALLVTQFEFQNSQQERWKVFAVGFHRPFARLVTDSYRLGMHCLSSEKSNSTN